MCMWSKKILVSESAFCGACVSNRRQTTMIIDNKTQNTTVQRQNTNTRSDFVYFILSYTFFSNSSTQTFDGIRSLCLSLPPCFYIPPHYPSIRGILLSRLFSRGRTVKWWNCTFLVCPTKYRWISILKMETRFRTPDENP